MDNTVLATLRMQRIKWKYICGLMFISMHGTSMALAENVIEKCQDSQGKWQYGNYATEKCQSIISTLSHQGVALRQRELLPNKRAKILSPSPEQITKDQQILRRYSSVDAIDYEQARKIASIDTLLKVNQRMLDDLDADIALLLTKPYSDIARFGLLERERALDAHQLQRVELNIKVNKVILSYENITTHYLQAKARKQQP
ncbi:MAG: hypothetical protein V3V09_01675 [Arenicellales bacterium]